MKKTKLESRLLLFVSVSLSIYFWLWVHVSSSDLSVGSSNKSSSQPLQQGHFHVMERLTPTFKIPDSMRGKTLIVAFCDHHFRSVGITWYQRMSRLGYDNHLLVATDRNIAEYLSQNTNFRYQVCIHESMPDEWKSKPKPKRDRARLELLMAVRWKYLVSMLKNGMHMILTDVDNIFVRFIDVDRDFVHQDQTTDVWHAYATKFPRKSFAQQGFVVCSGMSWWRSSPGGIRFAELMQSKCGNMCDDQRTLNNLLTSSILNMTWSKTQRFEQSRLTEGYTDDPRFLGLPTIGIFGWSSNTQHSAKIWDRDFAFRGAQYPEKCPSNTWVSMPILEAKSRQRAWIAKVESFQEWDKHCGNTTSLLS